MRPIIALLTDFGTRDHYVGALKGAILSIAPDAQVVDVLHEVAPHDVEGGAFALAAAYPAFPPRTVFVAVVDPGVGSSRRGLAIGAGSYRFVGPPLVATYSDVPSGEPCALVGSGGRLEFAVNGGSAASILGAGRGAPVRIRRVYQPAI